MKIYTGRAFTYPEKIDNKEVLGNPASVCVFEDDEEFPDKEEMSRIAIREAMPITTFVKHKNNNKFDLRYYFPNGSEINFCGHGTLVTSKIVKEFFNVNDINFDINFDNKFIQATCNLDGLVSITMPKYDIIFKFDLVKNQHFKEILNALNLDLKDVGNIYICDSLGDCVIEILDANKIKNLKPNFKKMIEPCKKLGLRGFMCTSKSNYLDFDYEIRVFAPDGGVDEDIACGSANTHIANFWNQKTNKNIFKSLYPHNNFDKYIGGIQYIEVKENNSIRLGGYVK